MVWGLLRGGVLLVNESVAVAKGQIRRSCDSYTRTVGSMTDCVERDDMASAQSHTQNCASSHRWKWSCTRSHSERGVREGEDRDGGEVVGDGEGSLESPATAPPPSLNETHCAALKSRSCVSVVTTVATRRRCDSCVLHYSMKMPAPTTSDKLAWGGVGE